MRTKKVNGRKYDYSEIANLYKSGLGCDAIAERLGANRSTISAHLRDFGISRSSAEANKARSLYDVSKMKDLYLAGLSSAEIAKIMGCSAATVTLHMRKMGLSRSNREAQQLRSEQGKSKGPRNGGRKINKGYVEIYMPDHHLANTKGYVREHCYVWEEHNQMQIPDGWHVHHLNGIKYDNRPENLVAMPNGTHALEHGREPYKARIRALEERIRQLEDQLRQGERL